MCMECTIGRGAGGSHRKLVRELMLWTTPLSQVIMSVFGGEMSQVEGTAKAKLLGYMCVDRDIAIGIKIDNIGERDGDRSRD